MRFKWKCDKLSQFSKLIEEMAKVKPGWGANIISLLPPCERGLQAYVVYQVTVTTETTTEIYVGLATNFINATGPTNMLSALRTLQICLELTRRKETVLIKWKTLKKCKLHGNITKKCSF